MEQQQQVVSIVCPMLNEVDGAQAFYDRANKAMERISPAVGVEFVFVDDGSTDGTIEVLRALQASDPRVTIIELSRNFGHQLAITAGIDAAIGDAVVVIDADLQDPPEVIEGLVSKWREGYEVVYGQRNHRAGESRFKRATAKGFYRFINRLSDVDLPVDVGDFRLMDRRVVNVLKQIREGNRYMRGIIAWVGFKQYSLKYDRDERFAGETKYPLRKMLLFASDGIASFSNRPLSISMQIGGLITLVAFFAALYILVEKLLNPGSQLPGYASMMAVILFLGGVQLLSIGILGQYLGRTYSEAKSRPLYIVADFRQPSAGRAPGAEVRELGEKPSELSHLASVEADVPAPGRAVTGG